MNQNIVFDRISVGIIEFKAKELLLLDTVKTIFKVF